MASRPPGSQADDQDQQPSSSGRPPDVTVYEDSPGPAGEGAGARRQFTGSTAPSAACSSPPQRPGRKRKRPAAFRAEVDGAPAAEAQDAWVVESLSGLKMKLKRQRVFSVLPEHHEVFNRLLEDPVVKKFLAWDKKLEVSDKGGTCVHGEEGEGNGGLDCVLAVEVCGAPSEGPAWPRLPDGRAALGDAGQGRLGRVGRSAGLRPGKRVPSGGPSCPDDRDLLSFRSYVASDMEEDNQAPKQAIFSFLYGKNRSQRPLFHRLRLQFIRSMGWRTRVTREECEQVGGLWRSGGGGEGCEEVGVTGDSAWALGTEEKAPEAGQGEAAPSSLPGAVCLSRSRLLIQSSGCGEETAPSCPRGPGTSQA
nr:putative speedy protein-like protein 3 [Kogia breviceps]